MNVVYLFKMVRLFLVSLVLLTWFDNCAQPLYYSRRNGEIPAGYNLNRVSDSADTKRIMLPSLNNKLSVVQNIKFPFLFNSRYYTNYKISDNGYITFNIADTVSHTPDAAFSNIGSLSNSIIAYWHDFELKYLPPPNEYFTIKVFSYTTGAFPNRTHIIQYYGLTQTNDLLQGNISNANVFSFAIVLHEGSEGRFDLIYNYFGKNAITGVTGAVNRDSTAYLVKNGPIGFPLAASSSLANTSIFIFKPGIQASAELYVKEIQTGNEYIKDEQVAITAKISNLGKDTISDFYYTYTVNSKDTFIDSLHLSTPLLPNGENTLTLTHSQFWETGNAGTVNTIKISALNTNDSLNKDSSIFSKKLKILRILGVHPIVRNTMLEVSTGGWCGYCPNAHLVAEDNELLYGSRFIPVSHHFGDPMQTDESHSINEAYEKGYPYGTFDRRYFSGQMAGWQNIIDLQMKDSGIVKMTIADKNYDTTTRTITYKIKAKFYDYVLGNFRIGAILTENNVRGYASPSQWSQNNYYSSEYQGGAGGPTHRLYYEPHYMDGYLHNYVVLDMPHGAWGKDSSLPEYIRPGDEFTLNVSYVLPATETVEYQVKRKSKYCNTNDSAGKNKSRFKPEDIYLIGFVAGYNEDPYKRPILNAGISQLMGDFTSGVTRTHLLQPKIYPNPGTEYIRVRLMQNSSAAAIINVYDISGQLVMTAAGSGEIQLDISSLPAGIYYLNTLQNGEVSGGKFIVADKAQ